MNTELREFKKKMRIAIAKYMKAEGCSCCRDNEGHEEAKKEIASLLSVKKYSDGSGYDFSIYVK